MVNKKGVSDVVTTVLIILLAIAAVVIVWGFVSNTIKNSGSGIDLSAQCLKVKAVPVSCSSTSGNVVIQLVSTGGAQVSGIKAVVTKADGTTIVGDAASVPTELGTVSVTLSGLTAGLKATASATVSDESGASKVCGESVEQVVCAA